MNILVISPWLPYPLISGGDQGIYHGLSVLDSYDTVIFSYPGGPEKSVEAFELEKRLPHIHVEPLLKSEDITRRCLLIKSKKVRRFVKKLMKKYLPKILDKVTPQDPTIDFRFRVVDEAFVKHIHMLIEKYQIDVVQVEMTNFLPMARHIPSSVKKVFVHHELQYVANSLKAEQLGLGWYGQERVANQKVEEIAMLNLYDEIVTVSSIDRQKLLDSGVIKPILSSFSVVSPPLENSFSKISERPKILSYVGPDLHYPNYDGVMWFLNNCWDDILKRDSEYCFQIVGKWTEDNRKNISRNFRNVIFLGFVENLGSAIGGTTMIVPLNIGSGIRMKILEAAQLGVPVVTTTVGAEGLPIRDGEQALIADSADRFVEEVFRMQDISLREKLVTNMQNVISESYSLEALRENRKPLYVKKG